MFSVSEKRVLLQLARSALESAVNKVPIKKQMNPSPNLLKPSGAFVTIRKGNTLRGCIGYLEPIKSLIDTIQEVTMKAALEDFRFLPVTSEELDEIEIEVSVISPMTLISDCNDISIGEHGLMVEHGNYRGLLLPQVAIEFGWDKDTFLSHTLRKAGIPENLWNSPKLKIFTFTAEIFSEQHSTHSM
ncbi:MAG TPA: AmmeMemoRadiSam system protein A [Bacteroidota bacterium]|nr:AmmeMemoRadiSam system protein A [Bacteroidota bacterium]